MTAAIDSALPGVAPVVSIIIPAYQTAGYIGATLESVDAQTFRDFETIVINDGSPDTPELRRVLEPFRDRIVYLEQDNRGSSAARNAGLRVARGRYVAMLDSDDLWAPGYLAAQVAALEADAALGVVFPDARLFGDTPDDGRRFSEVYPVDDEITVAGLLGQTCYVYYGVTARRELLLRVGGYDEALGAAEDLDLWVRILRAGGRMACQRRVLAHYRKRPGSHTSDPVWLNRNFLKLLDKVERGDALVPAERDAVRAQRARCYAELRLAEGKQALLAGDAGSAIAGLRDANAYARSPKISLALACLRVAPGLAVRAMRWRDRAHRA